MAIDSQLLNVDPQSVIAAADNPGQAIVALLDRARAWLIEATNVHQVNDMRAKAEAIRVYGVQAKMGKEAEQAACELRLRAERRIGELIRSEQASGRLARQASGNRNLASGTTRLNDHGITYDESAQFQKLADVPEDVFEDRVTELRESESLSRAALLRPGEEENTQQEQIESEMKRARDVVQELNARAPAGYDAATDHARMQSVGALIDAIHNIETLAPPEVLLEQVQHYQTYHFANLKSVVEWMQKFGRLWEEIRNEHEQSV